MLDRERLVGLFDSVHALMPVITKWIGWAAFLLGPALGLLHILAMLLMPGYGRRAIEQYDLVQKTGLLLAAPLTQYLILLGHLLCVIWLVAWGLRVVLIMRARLLSRSV